MTDSIPTQRKISNSEVMTWLTCQRRYYYQYDLNLRPKTYNSALARGIIGHELLQHYYTLIQQGVPKPQAINSVKSLMTTYDQSNFDLLVELSQILDNYFSMVDDSDWEILGVEQQHEIDLGNGITYVLRYDLLVRIISLNKVAIVDHKFVYDFWSTDDINLSPQFPKYMAAMRGLGIDVNRCILNQLRYRKIKPENWTPEGLFQRLDQIPTHAKMRNALEEQRTAAMQIVRHRGVLPAYPMPPGTNALMLDTVPSRNKITCRSCSVKELCLSEYDGGDVSYLIETQYEKNTQYGYNNEVAATNDERF